jgi:transcription elongation GreA/GreB family factor
MNTPSLLTPEQIKHLAELARTRTILDARATRAIVVEFGSRLGVENAHIVETKL